MAVLSQERRKGEKKYFFIDKIFAVFDPLPDQKCG
jgi:hypothetical protein